jgi:uncharacterized protein YhbP (UPF0306 family)
MIDASTRAQIQALLEQSRTASLATVDDDGRPHAANVQFAVDEALSLYFVSSPRSAHGRHTAVRREVAITVYSHDDTQPAQLRGLQMHGRCQMLTATEDWDRAWRLYSARFPFVAGEPFASLVKLQAFFRVTPTWVRWIDNRSGFGFKVEGEL